ncbi:MAG: hypothetical protein QM765_44990 [Myxococcales bacterium]
MHAGDQEERPLDAFTAGHALQHDVLVLRVVGGQRAQVLAPQGAVGKGEEGRPRRDLGPQRAGAAHLHGGDELGQVGQVEAHLAAGDHGAGLGGSPEEAHPHARHVLEQVEAGVVAQRLLALQRVAPAAVRGVDAEAVDELVVGGGGVGAEQEERPVADGQRRGAQRRKPQLAVGRRPVLAQVHEVLQVVDADAHREADGLLAGRPGRCAQRELPGHRLVELQANAIQD